ncbi:MAG TPA: nodulation protein NfeD [Gammaproteobacteria bacterium]|nr:nodulation protein NfeD [Gammaproteobacteria bacterium]
MYKWKALIIIFVLFSITSFALEKPANKAIVLEINGAVGPATQDYIQRGMAYAEKERAAAIIIQLNTPGGLETSMRSINEAIIISPIPVIAYVFPAGARAASAGTFIMYASHLAAMASGTNIGAASPVNILPGGTKSADAKNTEERKATNDASAYMRSLAQLRGRNADWAELAVRQAASLSASEAKRLKVIDEVADNYPMLLKKMDGHNVLVQGIPEKISTKNLDIKIISPDWRYQFLSFLTNPNVVYLLMLVALYGLFFEFSNPGLILPGVAGVIALLLILYAFQLVPINYTGLTLVVVGLLFIIFEIFITSHGMLGIGGVIAFIIGSIMLFDVNDANYQVALSLILIMSITTALFFLIILTVILQSHKKAVVSGQEALIGSEGVVLSAMNEQIVVRVMGEIWEARALVMLNPGQKIKVTKIHGLMLLVEPLSEKNKSK